MNLKDGISVIICCYNSSWIIKRCLVSLLNQVVPKGFPWEIVIVDNNCNDNTSEIVLEIIKSSNIDIKLIKETKPGLLNARKKGINCVQYKYTIYCDDDNLLCDNYVYGMYQLMTSDEAIGCAGGYGIAEFMKEPAPIILNHLSSYALGSQKKMETLFGAGLCVKTSVVREIYQNQKFYLTGRSGGKLLAGDDSELVLSIRIRGYKREYCEDLKFTHVLSPQRLTKDYFIKMTDGFWQVIPIINTLLNVLHDRSRYHFVLSYIRLYYNVVIGIITGRFFKDDLMIRKSILQIKAYHFWGIRKLLSVYNELEKVKDINRYAN